jgi:hypothetical protein
VFERIERERDFAVFWKDFGKKWNLDEDKDDEERDDVKDVVI